MQPAAQPDPLFRPNQLTATPPQPHPLQNPVLELQEQLQKVSDQFSHAERKFYLTLS